MSYRAIWKPATAIVTMMATLAAGAASGIAQDATPAVSPAALDGATVAVYAGACDASLDQPLGELGMLEHQRVIADTGGSPVPGTDRVAGQGVLLRGEDVNGNGVLDPGEDRNGNGQLDQGLLESEEAVPESAVMIADVSEVWMLDSTVDLDAFAPADQPLAMVVQQGSGAERRLLACGQFQRGAATEETLNTEEEGTTPLFVPLEPMPGAQQPAYRGFARLASDAEGASGGTRVVMFQTPPGEQKPTARQEATPTS